MAHQEIPPSATNHSNSLVGLSPSPLINAGTCTLGLSSPVVVDLGQNLPSSVHSKPCLQTWLQFEECVDTQVVLKAPKPNSRKRFRKKIGRLGRNIRQKLLCGFFSNLITLGKQKEVIPLNDTVELSTVVSNGFMADSLTPAT